VVSNSVVQTYNMTTADFIELLIQAETVEQLHQACVLIRRHYGFDYFAIFALFSRANQKNLCFVMRECDNEWNEHYQRKKYILIDPTIRLASIKTTPFSWHSQHYEKLSSLLNENETKVTDDALEFGLKNIFNAPFHLPGGSHGVIRFISNNNESKSPNDWKERISNNVDLFLLSSFISQTLIKLVKLSSCPDVLSQREKDILMWTAQGNNPAHIADKLQISHYTVCNHLRNVRNKLEVKNTTHAVAKAISTQLISC